ncbi:MAG TPA: DUF5335 family protein [Candidatus Polarisedimenticolaceae bacterium]|nr:DUF5335 family protein [Candidatus Polarisedimenticolaceae bacterium]
MERAEVPLDNWMQFFDDFTTAHRGWIVALDVMADSLGAQPEVTGLPLVGITVEEKDHQQHLEIMVGGRTDAHVTRIIDSPTRIWNSRDAIDVESDDGTVTLLRFMRVEHTDRLLAP